MVGKGAPSAPGWRAVPLFRLGAGGPRADLDRGSLVRARLD